MATAPPDDPEVAAVLQEGRRHRAQPMPARERRTELAAAVVFLAGAVALEIAAPSPVAFHGPLAIILLLTYAIATRIKFAFALGQTDPSLFVLVPMLFLEPAHVVPLLVLMGFLLGRAPDFLSGRLHPERIVGTFGDAIHTLGPALVLGLTTDGGPHADDWPWFLLAFVAFVAFDVAAGFGRAWGIRGSPPPMTLADLVDIYRLDALLAPVGLLAAFASAQFHYGFLLGAPLVLLLTGYARERDERMDAALQLSEERGRVLEAELAAARARADVLGAVSHGLQTPVAGVLGLTQVLERGDALPPDRRAGIVAALGVHARKLRHLVRQTLDLSALQAGGTLPATSARVPLAPLLEELAGWVPEGRAQVVLALEANAVQADAARVEQVLTILLDNACRWGKPGGTVTVASASAGDRVLVRVADEGPGLAEPARAALFAPPGPQRDADESQGVGLGLHVAHAVALAMDGDLRLEDGAPTTFVLDLPAAA